jgi:transcriptional regulator with XRE-family HTH domain
MVSLIESGDAAPSLSTLAAIAEALGTPITMLFEAERVVVTPSNDQEARLLDAFGKLTADDRATISQLVERLARK